VGAISFLVNERLVQLIHYLRRMQELPEAQQADLWRDSFPELTPDKLDHLLRQWLVSGQLATPLIEVTVQDFPTIERPLGDGDALAARSLLHLMVAHDESAARTDLAAALTVDRTNVLARLVHAAITGSTAPDDARATATAHPDDWRAWWLVGFAVQQGPEAADAFDKLCALAKSEVPECARPWTRAFSDGVWLDRSPARASPTSNVRPSSASTSGARG
jgi:hypothetical protein